SASWIHITAGMSGSGSGSVSFTVDANSSAARNGTITAGGQMFSISQAAANITPSIQISADSIANSASYAKGGVSPGLIVTIAAPGVGPADVVTEQFTPDGAFFTTSLAGVRVLFDGVAAPMVYAANGQCSAIVPYAVVGKASTQVQLEYQGALSNSVTLPVVASQPGLFSLDSSGAGPGAILDQQYNLNSVLNPAAIGAVIFLFGTGEGQTAPAGVDGKLATVPLPAPVAPVTVTIDGIDAPVLYAGAAQGLVAGVIQINVQIPEGVQPGARPVVVKVGQAQSPAAVTVAIR